MNEIRVNELIDAYLNCSLDGDDRASLEKTLLVSPRARELFWRKAQVHEELRSWGLEATSQAVPHSRRQQARNWLSRAAGLGPAAAAAMFGMLVLGLAVGAGAAWAIVPQFRAGLRLVVPVGNAGFEDVTAAPVMPTEGHPTILNLRDGIGRWAADRVRLTGAEYGITPAEGSMMIAFEQALAAPGPTDDTKAAACDLYQIIDLAPVREEITKGDATLEASVRFIDSSASDCSPVRFQVKLYVYDSEPDVFLEGWPESRLDVGLGTGTIGSPGSIAGSGWQVATAKVVLPPEARYAFVQILATSDKRGPLPAKFHRQYCDDVQLTFQGKALEGSSR